MFTSALFFRCKAHDGWTARYDAGRHGYIKVVRMLVVNPGVDVNEQVNVANITMNACNLIASGK